MVQEYLIDGLSSQRVFDFTPKSIIEIDETLKKEFKAPLQRRAFTVQQHYQNEK